MTTSNLDDPPRSHSLFAPGHFIDYVLSLPSIKSIWEAHVRHPFVLGLGSGTLPIESFRYYLTQDYIFLEHYARAICVSAAKAPSLPEVFTQAENVLSIRDELKMHISYCAEHFGLSESEMTATKEDPACRKYTDFVRETGEREDWLSMQVALAPCMYGYMVIGEYLTGWEGSVKGKENRYWSWVEQYAGNEAAEAAKKSIELLERHAAHQAPERIEKLVDIFRQAAELEIGFWDMGLQRHLTAERPHASQ